MRKRSLTRLGETEMEVLQHVWELGDCTVAQVRARMLRERQVAYTTVMTVMRKLANKGFLRYDADGATYVYSAARSPEDVRQEILDGLLDKVFNGSTTALVQTLVGSDRLTDTERAEIGRLVADVGEEGDR